MEESLALKIIYFKQRKRINGQHKGTLFHLQVSDLVIRDPMKRDDFRVVLITCINLDIFKVYLLNYILIFELLFLLSCFGQKSMFKLVLGLVLVEAHWFALQYGTIRAIILGLYYVLFCCKIRGSL
jgi:hypothetical protein